MFQELTQSETEEKMYPSTNRTEMYRQQHHQQQQQYLPQQQHHFPLYNQQYLPSPQQHQQQSFQPQPVNYPLQSQPSYHGSYSPQYLNGNDPVPLASNHPVPLAPAVHPVLLALREGQHKFEGAVDWGGLVAGRSADTARRRFKVLKKCVPASVKRQAFPAVLAHLFRTYLRED